MSIMNGYGKYKRYVNTESGYKLCSLWTSANTLHFDDGKTAQQKLGAIDGITDSLTATNSRIALSAAAGKSLQDQVNELNTGTLKKPMIQKIIALPTHKDITTKGAWTELVRLTLEPGTWIIIMSISFSNTLNAINTVTLRNSARIWNRDSVYLPPTNDTQYASSITDILNNNDDISYKVECWAKDIGIVATGGFLLALKLY